MLPRRQGLQRQFDMAGRRDADVNDVDLGVVHQLEEIGGAAKAVHGQLRNGAGGKVSPSAGQVARGAFGVFVGDHDDVRLGQSLVSLVMRAAHEAQADDADFRHD